MGRDNILGLLSFALFVLAVATLLAALSAPLGTRAGAWTFHTGFDILGIAANTALVTSFGSLICGGAALYTGRRGGRGVGFVSRRVMLWAILGTTIGAGTFAYPFGWLHIHQSVPPLHDITTDTENPPAFVAALELRRGATNSTAYGGEPVAIMQHVAFPEVRPIFTDATADAAFARALRAARTLGWEVVAEAPEEGRIEAVDTTFWFGFKDDIVVRITPQETGVRVDIRSLSRVGKSDAGTNARRIGRFLEAF